MIELQFVRDNAQGNRASDEIRKKSNVNVANGSCMNHDETKQYIDSR